MKPYEPKVWHCGSMEIGAVESWLQKFVDENVEAALKEYASDCDLQVSFTDPDAIYLFLAEGTGADAIGKDFSLRAQILAMVDMAEEAAAPMAAHLRSIADELDRIGKTSE